MKLNFRVKRRAAEGDPGGSITAALTLVATTPVDKNDPNHLAWRGNRPMGEVRLEFLDPALVERFGPNVEVTVAIRVRDTIHDDTSRVSEPPHQ